MSWYRRADSPYYSKKIKDLGINKDKNKTRLLRLFEYIKRNKEMKVSFFHGTSMKIWENIKKTGYFTSPKIRNVADRERRKSGLEEVFFTTYINYSLYYANRSADQDNSESVILHLEIPLIWVKEVADVILGTETIDEIYNEYGLQKKLNEIVNRPGDIDKIAHEILDFFINTYFERSDNEFTIKHAVPIRFVKQTTRNKPFLEYAVKTMLEDDNAYPSNIRRIIPKNLEDDPDIVKLINNNDHNEDYHQYKLNLSENLKDAIRDFFKPSQAIVDYGYKKAIEMITDPYAKVKDVDIEWCIRRGVEQTIYSYIEDFDLFKILPHLGNGKIVRSFFEQFGCIDAITEPLKRKMEFFLGREGKDVANSTSGYMYQEYANLISNLKDNVYTIEQLGIATKEQIIELENFVKIGGRQSYLKNINNSRTAEDILELYKNYSSPVKGFSIPPLAQDKEASEIAQGRYRSIYLDAVLQNVCYIKDYEELERELTDLQRSMKQPPIEQDVEAQKKYVQGIAYNINSRQTRKDRYYDDNERILDEITNANESDFPKILNLPEWIGTNPEYRKILIQAYKGVFANGFTNLWRLDKNLVHPFARADESGKEINYEKEHVLSVLTNDNSPLPNINYVKDDPELFSIYKEKLLKKITSNSYSNLILDCYAYVIFSGTKDIPADPTIYQAAVEKLKKRLQAPDQSRYLSQTMPIVITDSIAKVSKNNSYGIFDDPVLAETARNCLIKLTTDYYTANPRAIVNRQNKLVSSYHYAYLANQPALLHQIIEIEKNAYINLASSDQVTFMDIFSGIQLIMDRLGIKEDNETNQKILSLVKEKIMAKFPEACKQSLMLSNLFGYIQSKTFALFQNDPQFVEMVANSTAFLIARHTQYNDIENVNYHLNFFLDERNIRANEITPYNMAIASNPDVIDTYVKIFIGASGKMLQHQTIPNAIYSLESLLGSIPSMMKQSVLSDSRMGFWQQKLQEMKFYQNQEQAAFQAASSKATVNPTEQVQASGWYRLMKRYADDEMFTINPENQERIYDTFRNTYEKSTGKAWSKDKFFSRANNWRFYGDESGYITVREQASGLLKLTGMAGGMKGIYKGMQDLMSETAPIWGMVTKNIANMATKVGFLQATPQVVKDNIYKIPAGVFGGAKIRGVLPDGGVQFDYTDVGESVKYFIGNQAYFSMFMGS